jgi:tetratricopeptide (TPR) repeat protein
MPGSGAQIDWNNTDPTNLIEQIRAMPETSERFPDRIAACRRALEWVQREERLDQWAWLHAEIGFCLLASSVDNSDDNLRQAIAHYEKALDVYTPDISPKEWLGASRNLARAYKRWTGGDRATNLERAIQLQGEILRVYTREQSPQTWVQTHAELAYLYLHRIQGSETSNLEQALAHYQRTLEVWRRETYPIQWAKVQYNIGTTIFRLQRLGENRAAYQKRAIEHLEQALEVLTPETAFREWVKVQHSLGLAYAEYRQGDRVNNLTRAIGLLEEVSEVCQRTNLHVERAQAQNALGIAYLQSTHGGRSENVERAIGHFRQALEAQEQVGPPEQKALTLHNLSVAHTDRLLEDRTENLRQALVYGQAALDTIEQCPHTFSNWAMIKTGLAGALWKLATNLRQRGEQRQAIDRLEDAIKHGEEVVSALQRRSLPYWQAFACYNLANAYSDRIEGSRAKNRGQAIVCYHRALNFFNKENFPDRWANAHNDLAIIYLERSGRKGLGSTKKAIQHFNHALEVFEPDAFPISTLRVARNLGNLYFDLRRWQDAIEPYCQALDATERLYRFSVMRVSKETEIGETADLYRRNAYVLACSGDLRGAVVAMERGRARLLSEVLQREYADLETLGRSHPNLYRQYRQAASEIADLTQMDLSSRDQSSITALAPEMRKARRALDQAVEAIRQILDYEDFLAPSQFEDIVKAVRPGAPLVYIVVTPAGTVALVVTPTAVHPVHTDLTEEALHKRIAGQPGVLGGYLGAYDAWRRAPRDPAAHQAWFDTLNDTIHWLWRTLMGPIIRTLTDLDITHATLIPSGWLAFLPLHAAQASLSLPRTRGREEGATYALDQVAFSYALVCVNDFDTTLTRI